MTTNPPNNVQPATTKHETRRPNNLLVSFREVIARLTGDHRAALVEASGVVRRRLELACRHNNFRRARELDGQLRLINATLQPLIAA